jgi:long-subunit fatty acid transport protein
LFGSVRWADWSAATIVDSEEGDLISYDDDVFTYSLGVGRKFSDSFSGSVSLGYEAAQGGEASNLSPTDGNLSVSLGGKYTSGNMEVSAGVSYVMLGDATTELIGADFSGNTALGAGVKVAFRF